jgi:general stress protein 26
MNDKEPAICVCGHLEENHDANKKCFVLGCKCKRFFKTSKKDPDWMYKPILKTNTHADYDGNKIETE